MVSIILPYYNGAKYIRETVDSILSQTYSDWELIIVNDCSTELETASIFNDLCQLDKRIRILSTNLNSGAGAARNVGIRAATGRYIAFCDSDDWWYPIKLEEQVRYMTENNCVFSCTYYEDADENLQVYYTLRQPKKQNYRDLLVGCNIGTPGVMYDASIIGKRYMPEMRRAEDWGCWMLILRDVDFIHTIPMALWKYRHVPGSETANKLKMLTSVISMYTSVLHYGKIRAWMMAFFLFLPVNISKKIKKHL